jgi:ActR/RegA family two-component response regulator
MHECNDGAKAVRFIRQHKPEFIVADLEVRPSHTIATIEQLAISDVKFIIVDGAPENIAKVKKLLPNSIFTALSDIGNFLT